jgi:hypothetical protein
MSPAPRAKTAIAFSKKSSIRSAQLRRIAIAHSSCSRRSRCRAEGRPNDVCDNWPLEKKLNFWVEKPAMYFVPDLPPNLEAAVVRVIRQELARAKAEEAFNRAVQPAMVAPMAQPLVSIITPCGSRHAEHVRTAAASVAWQSLAHRARWLSPAMAGRTSRRWRMSRSCHRTASGAAQRTPATAP